MKVVNSRFVRCPIHRGRAALCSEIVDTDCGIGRDVAGYLRGELGAATNEIVQHGAAHDLGIAGVEGKSEQSFEDL